jgi:hypothetical protein
MAELCVCTRTWLYRWRNRARRCWGLFGAACFFWEEPPRSLTHCVLLAEAGVTEAVVTDKVHVESIHAASGWRACGGVRGAAGHTLGALMDDGRGSLCNQLRRAPSPPRERVPTMRPSSPALQSQVCIYSRSTLDVSGAYAAFRGTVCGQRYRVFTTTAEGTAARRIALGPHSLVAAP